jgi:hypothetical protein
MGEAGITGASIGSIYTCPEKFAAVSMSCRPALLDANQKKLHSS